MLHTDGDQIHTTTINRVAERSHADLRLVQHVIGILGRSHSRTFRHQVQVTLVAVRCEVRKVDLTRLHIHGPMQVAVGVLRGHAEPILSVVRSADTVALEGLGKAAFAGVLDVELVRHVLVLRPAEAARSEVEPLLVRELLVLSVRVVLDHELQLV